MDFIIQWVWYLLAFLVGSLVAWLLAAVSIKRTSEQEALADMPGSREPGDVVMNDVNWWLVAWPSCSDWSLTLAFMIRRVEREVPVYGTSGRGSGGAAAVGLASAKPKVAAPDVDAPDLDISDGDVPEAELPTSEAGAATATAGAAGGLAAAKLVGSGGGGGDSETAKIAAVGDEPYGAGSVRVARGADAPSGYTIKGNEDSMLYHSPDSPSYERRSPRCGSATSTTAEAAGFNRWDSGKSQRGQN